jgi:hypothetical protein
MDPGDAPAERIIRLPRNGPKPGQSTNQWLYGKDKAEQREIERLRWQKQRGH